MWDSYATFQAGHTSAIDYHEEFRSKQLCLKAAAVTPFLSRVFTLLKEVAKAAKTGRVMALLDPNKQLWTLFEFLNNIWNPQETEVVLIRESGPAVTPCSDICLKV